MVDLSFLTFISDGILTFITGTGNNLANGEKFEWSNIIDQNGTVLIQSPAIAVTLVKIEKETFVNKSNTVYKDVGYGTSVPSLNINLYLQFAAYNADHGQALKRIGWILSYFQSNPVLTLKNAPKLAKVGAGVDKLIFEIVNYSHQELSNLWSQLGAKYIPSVVYKMRMIIIDESNPVVAPPITQITGTMAEI
jgi:hypothetical protein